MSEKKVWIIRYSDPYGNSYAGDGDEDTSNFPTVWDDLVACSSKEQAEKIRTAFENRHVSTMMRFSSLTMSERTQYSIHEIPLI